MSLSHDQIRRIARLARIAIRPEEFQAVLALVEELRAVDTAGVEPMSHAVDAHLSQGQRLRPDEVTEPDRHAAYQSVAPAVQDDLYLVPKVIE